MKNINWIILITTAYVIIYTILASFPFVPDRLIIGLFSFSPFLVIYMAYKILKDGEVPEGTWEEGYWYEDKPQMESYSSSKLEAER